MRFRVVGVRFLRHRVTKGAPVVDWVGVLSWGQRLSAPLPSPHPQVNGDAVRKRVTDSVAYKSQKVLQKSPLSTPVRAPHPAGLTGTCVWLLQGPPRPRPRCRAQPCTPAGSQQ